MDAFSTPTTGEETCFARGFPAMYTDSLACIFMKRYRQSAILDLVSREAICSQDALGRQLRKRGFHATQATISRDIKELQLVKRASDGAYERPGVTEGARGLADAALRRAIVEYLRRVDLVQQLLVLRTDPGLAQPPGAGDRQRGSSGGGRYRGRRRHHPGDHPSREGRPGGDAVVRRLGHGRPRVSTPELGACAAEPGDAKCSGAGSWSGRDGPKRRAREAS